MNLRNLSLKKAYSSDYDDILNDFYIPALTQSSEYCRLTGFFSSTSLAVAARGILGLIRNGGIMKLVVSPRLSKDDLDIILSSLQDTEMIVEQRLLEELDQIEDEFARDHISALGWMVANERLQIKVAIPKNISGEPLAYIEAERTGLFHQKVGILGDSNGNTISFSGSVNETAAGWLENVEEFKVFRFWDPSEQHYVQADTAKFNKFWTNQSSRVRVIGVPHAVEERLIEIAPTDIWKIDLERHYKRSRTRGQVELFSHQRDAVDAWVNNDMMGIFAMATGTGKTFTALGCLNCVSQIYEKFLVVVACPYQHLIQQWRREINKFGVGYDELIIADSSNRRWRNLLADGMMDISLGHMEKVITLTTHKTFSSEEFISIIQEHSNKFKILLIADEVHGLGAEKSRKGLVSDYDLRLGLSATPRRWFDTTGTDAIYDFFNGEIYHFGLEEAINNVNPATGETYLVPYRYLPRFAFLASEEMEDYAEKTRRIGKIFGWAANDLDKEKYLESLMFARADIIKNARKKLEVIDEILDSMEPPIKWTIIYCSPQQIDSVMEIVNNHGIITHRFTMEEGTDLKREFNNLSERDYLLQSFGESKYQALVAMKCLDEGVDVPPARTAIIMASSGNPREYIQRIGRVIRRCPGKHEATIYDIIVLPSIEHVPPEIREMENRILRNEAKRYKEIAHAAINNAEALATISEAITAKWE